MSRSRLKILVVDDEPMIVEVFQEILGQKYDVHSASTASEVHRVLDRDRFDVLITDWNMPGLNGLELAERMCDHRDCRVIVITGADEDSMAGIRSSGVSVHRKPVRWKALLNELESIEVSSP
ncbi:MAG TPA: response regulator [Fibrobacteria bacterium]|nr:response regulator [Fibrobacteria bacterium]HOX50797.1 response regulator [Fibrobacteria bacterium]